MRLDITLRVRDQAALTSFIAALWDRHSPLFHHFLRPGQFGPRFGPTLAQVARVDAALRSMGLAPGKVSSDRLSIPVRASAAAVERAFATPLVQYRLAGGRVAYANSAAARIPATAARYVAGVLGLETVDVAHSLLVRPRAQHHRINPAARPRIAGPTAGPRPCAAATGAATSAGSFTADQLASHYGMSPLYALNDLGRGVRVALVELEPDSASDISAYLSCYGLHSTVNYVKVDNFSQTGAGSGEAALDIEDVAGLAPDATIDVFQAPNGGEANIYDIFLAIINNAFPDPVVSTSWGLCELHNSFASSEQSLFEQAATQGQTVIAAAGDSGSTGCLPDGGPDASALAVSDPASQPYVLGVGGTSIGSSGETAWNESSASAGAGGGGVSVDWCMPSYQYQPAIPGLVNGDSQAEPGCSGSGVAPYARQVPDVSAVADPNTGYTIFYSGAWRAIGGTSAAAPLWAAVAALTDASPFCRYYGSGNAGVQSYGLYIVAGVVAPYIYDDGEALSDVTSGNNDYTPSGYTGGLYPATRGYDMATGLGTPLASGYRAAGVASNFYPGLTALMCDAFGTKNGTASVTSISPNAGPLKGGNILTVRGSGFLPIPGANMARVGPKTVAASCTSTTRCTVRLPPGHAGIANIRMVVEDLSISAATSHSRYRYASAPRITSLSPPSGSAGGGTRITIRGRNFFGTVVVHFGRRTARIVSRSSTKIIVVAPPGSGTVTVRVTAAGGISSATPASRYRY